MVLTRSIDKVRTVPFAESAVQLLRHNSLQPLRHRPFEYRRRGRHGEHATSVNNTGNPTLQDFVAVGTKNRMVSQRCMEIYDEVKSACGELLRHTIQEH
jgi:hypothetical protein